MSARETKEHAERKNEILDAAQELFYAGGYEGTSVNAIIEKVGVSKGTFYHYFKSKEELLDSLTVRMTMAVLGRAREAAKPGGKTSPVDRLNSFFAAAASWKTENLTAVHMMMKLLFHEGNDLLRQKTEQWFINFTKPLMAEIVKHGIDEGVFDTPYAYETAELVLDLFIALRETVGRLFIRLHEEPDLWGEIERKLRLCRMAVERILGAPEGSVKLVDEKAMAVFRDWFTSSHDAAAGGPEQSLLKAGKTGKTGGPSGGEA